MCEQLSTPSDEGYARIMLRGSTTLKTADGPVSLPGLHPLCASFREKSHLCSPSSPLVRLA
jgi:hypothetical protein